MLDLLYEKKICYVDINIGILPLLNYFLDNCGTCAWMQL
jgi:hypothetical protein